MLVKTFQAGEMSEALRMVKAEMGLDAMILSSKKARRGGILGYFSKPYFEVTAALEPRPAQRGNPYREEPPQVQERERELSTREEFQNSMLGPLAREVRELKLRLEALTRRDAELAQPAVAAVEPQQELAQQPPRVFAREELEEIKKLLYNAVAGNKEKQVARPVSFPLASLTEESAQFEQPELARQTIVRAVRGEQPLLEILADELRGEELGAQTIELLMEQLGAAAEDGACLEELRGLLAEAVAGMVKCSGSLRMKKNGPRIMALVGPTGVGKTTTIAKLAAMHALNRGVSVAMITTDNFRVGAVEQLKTYAKIMDLPLEVASSGVELNAALAKHSDKDLILIDTAGRSPKDSERIDELRGYLESTPGIEAYLCLSATTRSSELDEVIATFGVLPISRLLFTKLDESRKFGCILETYLKHKLPLSYLSTGQKVPEDLEVATSRKIASLVVKESV